VAIRRTILATISGFRAIILPNRLPLIIRELTRELRREVTKNTNSPNGEMARGEYPRYDAGQTHPRERPRNRHIYRSRAAASKSHGDLARGRVRQVRKITHERPIHRRPRSRVAACISLVKSHRRVLPRRRWGVMGRR